MAGNKGKGKVKDICTSEGQRRPHELGLTASSRRMATDSQPAQQSAPAPQTDQMRASSQRNPGYDYRATTAFCGDDELNSASTPNSLQTISESELQRINQREIELRRGDDEEEEDDDSCDLDYRADMGADSEAEDVDMHATGGKVAPAPSYLLGVRGARGRFEGLAPSCSTNTTKKRKKGSSSNSGGNADWIIRGPMPGGPSSADVIPSYGGHVAVALWDGTERSPPVQVVYSRPGQIRTLETMLEGMTQDVRDVVEKSGLSHIPGLMFPDLDIPLIAAFVERWQPDTNTFHLPFGEMTIMLHDVEQILGLNVDGRIPWRAETFPIQEATVDFFGAISLEMLQTDRIWKDGKIVFDKLMQRGNSSLSHATKSRAWIIGCIGSALLTDKSRTSVRPAIVMDTHADVVEGVAWGAVTLADLYRELGVASRLGCKGVAGCLTLLQAWIFEHFHCFRPVKGRPAADFDGYRAAYWSSIRGFGRGPDRLMEIRRRIDSLIADEVTWTPYGDNPACLCPRTTFTGCLSCYGLTEPYMPMRTLRQLGYVQSIPPPIIRPRRANRPSSSIGYSVSFDVDREENIWVNYGFSSRLVLYDMVRCRSPMDAVREYVVWYNDVSHPQIMSDQPLLTVPDMTSMDWWAREFYRRAEPYIDQDTDEDLPGTAWVGIRDLARQFKDLGRHLG